MAVILLYSFIGLESRFLDCHMSYALAAYIENGFLDHLMSVFIYLVTSNDRLLLTVIKRLIPLSIEN